MAVESPIEISDFETELDIDNVDGLHGKDTQNTDIYVPITTLLSNTLTADENGDIDGTGLNLVNFDSISVSGLTDLIPYIQSVDLITNPSGIDLSEVIDYYPLDEDISNFVSKNFIIREEVGKADINTLQFPRAGFYNVNLHNIFSVNYIGLSKSGADSLSSTVSISYEVYDYDSNTDTLNELLYYSEGSGETVNVLTIPSTPTDTNQEYAQYASLHVYIKDPARWRLKIKVRHSFFASAGISLTSWNSTSTNIVGIYSQR